MHIAYCINNSYLINVHFLKFHFHLLLIKVVCNYLYLNSIHFELNHGYQILSTFSGWTFLGNWFIFRPSRWHPPSVLAGGPQWQGYGRSRSLITVKVAVNFCVFETLQVQILTIICYLETYDIFLMNIVPICNIS